MREAANLLIQVSSFCRMRVYTLSHLFCLMGHFNALLVNDNFKDKYIRQIRMFLD